MCGFRCYYSAISLCRCWRGVLLRCLLDSQNAVISKSTEHSTHSQLLFVLAGTMKHRQIADIKKVQEHIIQFLFGWLVFKGKLDRSLLGGCRQPFSPP